MSELRDVVLIAQRLADQLGRDGQAAVEGRAEALLAAGEPDDAAFWRRVALAMRSLDTAPPPTAP